ncbi:MerR family transcriptional regulator [Nonomuraea sp. NPDC059194]|uniref:MerR family transcriptional regulator n=1 Tax=Nonomuraea sp. NPDC059194 TaxID=3346764 RepID=UPI0036D1C280
MADQRETAGQAGYGIGAVARRLGVPAPTLRTWNLRYGIGPSGRSPGGHRRYDEADLRRLEEMNRLIHQGVAPADAARAALRLRLEEVARPAVAGADDSGAVSAGAPVPSAAMLVRAATVLDAGVVDAGVAAAIARHGVAWTWQRLVLPVFEAISARQARTGVGVEVEHVFSDRVLAALHPLVERPAAPVNGRPVLLACAEDEQHSLPVYALGAVLAGPMGVEVRVLGARTPYVALADAMRRLGPCAVFVWSQQEVTGDPAPLGELPSSRPPCRVVVGGPGWWSGLPRGVVRVSSLDEAVRCLLAATS